MRLSAPAFWYDARPPAARLLGQALSPLGRLYGWAVRKRFDLYYPVPMEKPVLCVGNLVAGGAGKTPVVEALVPLMQQAGYNPHILTRGYGGEEAGPLQVAPQRDTAADVGDEALLLVESAPTWVSRSRALGAQAAIDTGATLVIMDDGFQNPAIYKDFALLVADGEAGFGNGRVMPAGPLREELDEGFDRADALVVVGEDTAGVANTVKGYGELPVFQAALRPVAENPDVAGKPVFAFAGIGRPEKFRRSLEAAGAVLQGWGGFPDHFPYTEDDLRELVAAADAQKAMIITTAKDHVRLPPALKARVLVFRVRLEFQDAAALTQLIVATLQARA
jgi:tetraacyldisaccharide 4'-kinase